MSAGGTKAAWYRRVTLRDVAGTFHNGPLEILRHNATLQHTGSALLTACVPGGVAHTTHKLAQVSCARVLKDTTEMAAQHDAVLRVVAGDIVQVFQMDDQNPGYARAAKFGTDEIKLVPYTEEYLSTEPCVRLGAWGGESGEKDHQ